MKYMLMIYSGATTEPACGVEDWMAYDKAVREAGIRVSSAPIADFGL
ncbi:hypothetical protein [Nonomuraea dietziae]